MIKTTRISSAKDAYGIMQSGGVIYTKSFYGVFVKMQNGNMMRSTDSFKWVYTKAKLYNHCLYWRTEKSDGLVIDREKGQLIETSKKNKLRVLRREISEIRREYSQKVKAITIEIEAIVNEREVKDD